MKRDGVRDVSDQTVTIRRARRDDWRLLKSIRLEALLDTPDAFGSSYESARNFSDEQWATLIDEHCYFLAERGASVVGMASGGFNDFHPGTLWVYAMFVTPDARGSDVASRLVEAVSEWARDQGARDLYLHVTTTVERARSFYHKLGFTPTGETFAMQRDPSLVLMSMHRDIAAPEVDVRRAAASEFYELRRRVLRNDDPTKVVADPRDDEPSTFHFGAYLGDRLVVSSSFYPSRDPLGGGLVAYQLRFMATDFDVQGRGYGALVLAKADVVLRAHGADVLWANARDSALGFYRATGWDVIEGSEHVSAETQLPHTVIVKRLTVVPT